MTNSVLPAQTRPRSAAKIAVMILVFAIAPALLNVTTFSQGRQLSLADILIALRSKKAPLADRNKLLSEAVSSRGTTFDLTPEIEKELSVTGADKELISSIRKAARKEVSIVAASATGPMTQASSTEIRDPALLQSRAMESVIRGDLNAAIIDFTKVIELDPTSISATMGRARAYYDRNLFTLAITDLSKVIELDAKNVAAYSLRAQAYEKKAENELAIADHNKVFQIDPTNEMAKAAIEKWNAAQQAKLVKEPVAQPVQPAPVVLPEFVDLGRLTEAQTTKMVKPVYSQAALNARISGQVIVEVELDTKGNVVKVKTVTGHPYLRKSSEDAARDSTFKPAMIGNVAVKARGIVVYNYIPKSFR